MNEKFSENGSSVLSSLDSQALPEATKFASSKIEQLKSEISSVLVGQKEVLNQVLLALFADGHILVEGVPGLGKTLLLRALAKSLGGKFMRIQFTPDLMPADVTGHAMYDALSSKFTIRKGPVFTNFLLADEINRAPAKTQAALLEVMQEQQVTIEGESFKLNSPFMVLATKNPIEQEGTYPLPEAELDRFLMKITMDYPPEDEEAEMVTRITKDKSGQTMDLDSVNSVLTPEDVLAVQKAVTAVKIDQQVINYAVAIVRKTREWPGVYRGAGPRACIALVGIARVSALMDGRDFLLPDDIKLAALPVLRHRVALSADLEIDGIKVDSVLTDILTSVAAPRV